jgi:hypothetical protein
MQEVHRPCRRDDESPSQVTYTDHVGMYTSAIYTLYTPNNHLLEFAVRCTDHTASVNQDMFDCELFINTSGSSESQLWCFYVSAESVFCGAQRLRQLHEISCRACLR